MVERAQLPADQRRFHDAVRAIRRHPISGPFITLLNSSPDLATRVAHLGHYFHARGQADESIVPMRVRGLIAAIGARALDGVYEWAAWINWALDAGVPQAAVDAIRERKPLGPLPPEDALVMDICVQLASGDHRLDDRTFAVALDRFGAQGLVELVAALGYFALIAIPLNAFEIEMASEQLALRKPFAPLPIDGHPGGAPAGRTRAPFPPELPPGSTPRIPPILRIEDLAPANRHFYDRIVRTRGRIAGPFQVLLHSPDLADRIAVVGEPLLYGSAIGAPARALVWLLTAAELDCDYEWVMARAAAQAAGLPSALIEAAGRRQALPGATPEQRVVADFCHQLLRGNHHVSDEAYRAAIERFGVPATVQIAATIGYFFMQAALINAFDVRPEGDPSELVL
jgi:4-carboxymuconolactone decarboxylase